MTIVDHASFSAKDVKVHSREIVFHGFIEVEKLNLQHRLFHANASNKTLHLANKNDYIHPIQRELIKRKTAAGILLYDRQAQCFALIEQFRVGAIDDPDSAWQLEVIAGVLDGNEAPETCVRRESLEESGCEVSQIEHLFSFYPSAGACSEYFHLYASDVRLPKEGGIFGLAEEGENIKLHIFNFNQITTLFQNNRLKNAPVIMALQWLSQKIKDHGLDHLHSHEFKYDNNHKNKE